MRTSTPKRGRKAAKRLDLSDLRHVLKDGRIWTGIGIATAPDDGSPHWRIEVDDAGEGVDVLVDVVLQPEGIPVSARLAAGVWIVPAIGDEVIVVIPAGRVDFMPAIVGLLSSNNVPTGGGQGPQPGRIVLAMAQVLVHDGTGGAEELVKRSEFLKHTHVTAGTGPATPPTLLPSEPYGSSTDFPGTLVLRAK